MMGVGSATTYTFVLPPSLTDAGGVTNYHNFFHIGADMTLVSFEPMTWAVAPTCTVYRIYSYTAPNTMTFVVSWTLSNPLTWTQIINRFLTGWLYSLSLWHVNQGSACIENRSSPSWLGFSYFTASWWFANVGSVADTNLFVPAAWWKNWAAWWFVYWIQSITFSWTIYWPPAPPPTIHYNWTTLSFAGTDIRLQGNFRYSLSGAADAIFRSSPFRSLLRRH